MAPAKSNTAKTLNKFSQFMSVPIWPVLSSNSLTLPAFLHHSLAYPYRLHKMLNKFGSVLYYRFPTKNSNNYLVAKDSPKLGTAGQLHDEVSDLLNGPLRQWICMMLGDSR